MTAPKPAISFEFFPPKSDDGWAKLQTVHEKLSAVNPEFFSVTYGAGGSTQEDTVKTVLALHDKGISTAPHISCIGSTGDKVLQLLRDYADHGIDRLVALRGDMPSGMGGRSGQFAYAEDLVVFIQKHFPKQFHIEVAAYPEMHPQARDMDSDLQHFISKVSAGASGAITQYFYNADSYLYFRDRVAAAGCDVPITPGVMPILNFSNLLRFSDNCGAEIPRWIQKKMEGFRDDSASVKAFGHDVVTDLCQRLIAEGVPGLHFYSMNQSNASLNILKEL